MKMQINVNCNQCRGYFDATVDLNGTENIDNPVVYDAIEPMDAIAGAVLEYLMKTNQLTLSINGIEIKTTADEEYPFEAFFDHDDWLYDNNVIK